MVTGLHLDTAFSLQRALQVLNVRLKWTYSPGPVWDFLGPRTLRRGQAWTCNHLVAKWHLYNLGHHRLQVSLGRLTPVHGMEDLSGSFLVQADFTAHPDQTTLLTEVTLSLTLETPKTPDTPAPPEPPTSLRSTQGPSEHTIWRSFWKRFSCVKCCYTLWNCSSSVDMWLSHRIGNKLKGTVTIFSFSLAYEAMHGAHFFLCTMCHECVY